MMKPATATYGTRPEEEARVVVPPPPPRMRRESSWAKRRVAVGASIALLGAAATCAYVALSGSHGVDEMAAPKPAAAMAQSLVASLAADAHETFESLDLDGDGLVTVHEYVAGLTARQNAELARLSESNLSESYKDEMSEVVLARFSAEEACIQRVFEEHGVDSVDKAAFESMEPLIHSICSSHDDQSEQVNSITDTNAPTETTPTDTTPTDTTPTETTPTSDAAPPFDESIPGAPQDAVVKKNTVEQEPGVDAPVTDGQPAPTESSSPTANDAMSMPTDAPPPVDEPTEVSPTEEPTETPPLHEDPSLSTDAPVVGYEPTEPTTEPVVSQPTDEPLATTDEPPTDGPAYEPSEPTTEPVASQPIDEPSPGVAGEDPSLPATGAAPAYEPSDPTTEPVATEETTAPTSTEANYPPAPTSTDSTTDESSSSSSSSDTSSQSSGSLRGSTTTAPSPAPVSDDASDTPSPAVVSEIKQALKELRLPGEPLTNINSTAVAMRKFLDGLDPDHAAASDESKSAARVAFEAALTTRFDEQIAQRAQNLAFASLQVRKEAFLVSLLQECIARAGSRFERDPSYSKDAAATWITDECLAFASLMTDKNGGH